MKHTYEIREATEEDAIDLAPRIRQADLDEVAAVFVGSVEDALLESINSSPDPKAGVINGVVECLFGVGTSSLLSVKGSPWMLASGNLKNHAKPFLRESREYINSLKADYIEMSNFVDARNSDAIRWLQWLGFEIYEPKPYGPKDFMFHKFEIRRNK